MAEPRSQSKKSPVRPALRLVPAMPKPVCRETVEACRLMYEYALAGELRGMAAVCQAPRGRFHVEVIGDCAKDPVLTRGMVACLDDELQVIIQTKANEDD